MGYANGCILTDFHWRWRLAFVLSDSGIDGAIHRSLMPVSLRAHLWLERGGDERKDDILKCVLILLIRLDSETFTQLRFGLYTQDRN